ncbi:transporter substrate-binding protein [Pseudotabrizicola sp. 4114]|uniref:transporter substrate-binding protein n=1 Tax=Pseudotabrizicola sp. 4114 TaxID=2817731 RepID=UPI00285E11D3|nr:branched-chain amino acid transport system substrate-binding protein [Pseudorhodobacter sp. 4114]
MSIKQCPGNRWTIPWKNKQQGFDVMNRRSFLRTASGALAFASGAGLLAKAGLAEEPAIKIANILDATGGLNVYSLKQIKATAMAVDDINAAGGLLGRPVEVMFYDSQSNNQLNSQYTTQALLRDKADVVLGGITSASREVMRPIVQKFKGFYIYNSLYEGGVCDFRFMCPGLVPDQQVQPLIEYVVGEKGLKRAYILAADYNYGQLTAKWMQKFIRGLGAEDVAVEFFPLDVSNFAPVLARIQDVKPDVVLSALVGDAHMSFYRQYETSIGKKSIPIASTTYGLGRENAVLSPDENEGLIVATSFFDDLGTPAASDFVSRFKAFSGEDDYVGEYAEYGYRGMMLWAEAVRKAGSVAADAVAAAVGGVSYQGAGGLYTVDPQTHHLTMDVHIASGNRSGSFDVIKSFSQRAPTDLQAVCNLIENPTDTTQYEPSL